MDHPGKGTAVDGMDWLAALSLVVSALALGVAFSAYKLNRDAPRKAQQRQLRARVLEDAEKTKAGIKASRIDARFKDDLDIDSAAARSVTDYGGDRSTQFLDQTLPRAIGSQTVPLLKWIDATSKYESARHNYLAGAGLEQRARSDSTEGTSLRWTEGVRDEARLALETASNDLRQSCEAANEAIDEIIRTIHRLDKSPD